MGQQAVRRRRGGGGTSSKKHAPSTGPASGYAGVGLDFTKYSARARDDRGSGSKKAGSKKAWVDEGLGTAALVPSGISSRSTPRPATSSWDDEREAAMHRAP